MTWQKNVNEERSEVHKHVCEREGIEKKKTSLLLDEMRSYTKILKLGGKLNGRYQDQMNN